MKDLNCSPFFAANRLNQNCGVLIELLKLIESDQYTHSDKRAFAKTCRAIIQETLTEIVRDEKKGEIPF